MLEHAGFAPFSDEKLNVAEEELNVGLPPKPAMLFPSTSTYTITLLLLGVVAP